MTWTPAALAQRLGGDEKLARELVEIFLDEYAGLLEGVRTSVGQGDSRAIRRSAHALKGSVGNFVDEGPTETARAIERTAATSRLDELKPLVEQLEREVAELVDAMRRLLESTSCAS